MLLEAITIGLLVGQYIYHRLTAKGAEPKSKDFLEGARLDEGGAMPFFYGRVLLRNLVCAWYGNAEATQRVGHPDGTYQYKVDLVFVLGVPFFDGLFRLHNVYVGDAQLVNLFGAGGLAPEVPASNPAAFLLDSGSSVNEDSPEFTSIDSGELGDGNSAQSMTGSTTAGFMIIAGNSASDIPSFRGFATLAMRLHRYSASLPTIALEASTYPIASALPDSPGTSTDDPNPVDVLYDLHTAPMKLALAPAKIDLPSWQAAAQTLYDEEHGYSRCWDSAPSAEEARDDVLRQIDGAIDEDPTTGKLRLKLIRADFNPADIQHITVHNCERIEGFAAGGWTDLPNKIRVVYTARDDGYRDGSATADSQANAVGQDGIEREVVLRYPGINTPVLAGSVAARELNARCRPLAKMTAIVSREFWRTMVGDPVAVSWPELQIYGRIFRVGRVNRGGPDSNVIALDLIEDFFYTHRWETTDTGGLPSHPLPLG
jgi:hypothetical protein